MERDARANPFALAELEPHRLSRNRPSLKTSIGGAHGRNGMG